MNDSIIRYQYNPMLADTVGFFDFCIPITNESLPVTADSLQKYYDYSIYNYITPPPQPKHFTPTISIFGKHNLSPVHTGPLTIKNNDSEWITIIFVVCLLVFAWIQTSYSKRLGQIFRAVAQTHYVNQLEREGNLFKERITLGLGFIYYIISSVLIFQMLTAYEIIPLGISTLAIAGIILGCLFCYQLLKSFIVYVSGIVFNTAESAHQYQLNILIFNHIIGIILFPIVIIAFYWNSIMLLIVGAIIFSLLLLYRLFRGILTGLANRNYNLFYLFLYLCTLEILPLLLLYKVISKI